MTETSARPAPATAVYRGMDRASLDAAYNNGAAVVDSADWLARWRELSTAVRSSPRARLDIPYASRPRTRLTILFVTHSVEEAALLADRVLVMSAGPGRIESDIRIDLPRPRDVSSPEFNAVRRELAQRLTSHMAPARVSETAV